MDADYVTMSSPGSSGAADPFYVVKQKVETIVASIHQDFERWQALGGSDSGSPEVASVTKSIKQSLKQCKSNLKDLDKTIQIVKANRSKFASIDDQELSNRKGFVSSTKADMQHISNMLQRSRTKSRDSGASPLQREMHRGAADYVGSRAQQAQLIERKQDVVLEDMSAALSRLGDVAGTIGVELKQQDDLLTDMNEEMDETQEHMNMVMKKLTKLLGTSDKGKLCCIFVLFIIACVLAALVFVG